MIAQFEVLLNFFLELLKKMLCLKKNRKKACHAFYWRTLRRRKRGKKKRRVFPIIGHFGGLRKPKVVPACPQPASQSSWPPGRGHEKGQVRRPEPTPRPCSRLPVWAQLSTARKRWASPSPSSLKNLIQTSLFFKWEFGFLFLSFFSYWCICLCLAALGLSCRVQGLRLITGIFPCTDSLVEACRPVAAAQGLGSLTAWKWKSLRRAQLFGTPWTIWNSPGQNTGVGSLSLLQGIFPTQGPNPGLPHRRRILHQLIGPWSPDEGWNPSSLHRMVDS